MRPRPNADPGGLKRAPEPTSDLKNILCPAGRIGARLYEFLKNLRLKDAPLDLSLYDEICLGYPIWRYDLPMAVYGFLDKYDLSGKTIYPFCSHGGSRFLRTINDIAKLEPGARVEREGLAMRRNDVLDDANEKIDDWLKSLKK